MRRPGLALFGLLLLFSISAAWADSIPIGDPKMIIVEGGDSSAQNNLFFQFRSNSNGGGFLEFQNNTGDRWDTLSITTPAPDPIIEDYTFLLGSGVYIYPGSGSGVPLHDAFKNYTADIADGMLYVTYYDANSIAAGANFSIILNTGYPFDDPNGVGGWLINGKPVTFSAVANPEPGTLLLILSGLAGLALAARFRR